MLELAPNAVDVIWGNAREAGFEYGQKKMQKVTPSGKKRFTLPLE